MHDTSGQYSQPSKQSSTSRHPVHAQHSLYTSDRVTNTVIRPHEENRWGMLGSEACFGSSRPTPCPRSSPDQPVESRAESRGTRLQINTQRSFQVLVPKQSRLNESRHAKQPVWDPDPEILEVRGTWHSSPQVPNRSAETLNTRRRYPNHKVESSRQRQYRDNTETNSSFHTNKKVDRSKKTRFQTKLELEVELKLDLDTGS